MSGGCEADGKVTNYVWVDEQEFSPLYDFLPCKLVEHQTIAWLPTGKWETDQFSVKEKK